MPVEEKMNGGVIILAILGFAWRQQKVEAPAKEVIAHRRKIEDVTETEPEQIMQEAEDKALAAQTGIPTATQIAEVQDSVAAAKSALSEALAGTPTKEELAGIASRISLAENELRKKLAANPEAPTETVWLNVYIRDSATGERIAGATVRLWGYEIPEWIGHQLTGEKVTGVTGGAIYGTHYGLQAYRTYQVAVSAWGYVPVNTSVRMRTPGRTITIKLTRHEA